MEPKAYKENLLEEFVRRFQKNHNSLPDAYALIWAIDVYASLASYKTQGGRDESKFKDDLQERCEAFKIIRSASNAIKHIERNDGRCFVYSMGAINEGEGSSAHAWFNGVPAPMSTAE
jgi:hypothetical protein